MKLNIQIDLSDKMLRVMLEPFYDLRSDETCTIENLDKAKLAKVLTRELQAVMTNWFDDPDLATAIYALVPKRFTRTHLRFNADCTAMEGPFVNVRDEKGCVIEVPVAQVQNAKDLMKRIVT